jgi:hypothetical protein
MTSRRRFDAGLARLSIMASTPVITIYPSALGLPRSEAHMRPTKPLQVMAPRGSPQKPHTRNGITWHTAARSLSWGCSPTDQHLCR